MERRAHVVRRLVLSVSQMTYTAAELQAAERRLAERDPLAPKPAGPSAWLTEWLDEMVRWSDAGEMDEMPRPRLPSRG